MNIVCEKFNIFEAVGELYYKKNKTESAYCFLRGVGDIDQRI